MSTTYYLLLTTYYLLLRPHVVKVPPSPWRPHSYSARHAQRPPGTRGFRSGLPFALQRTLVRVRVRVRIRVRVRVRVRVRRSGC